MALKYSCFVQMPCAKTPEFGIRRILGLYAGFLFYQQPYAKAPEFGIRRILGLYAGSRFGTRHAVSEFSTS